VAQAPSAPAETVPFGSCWIIVTRTALFFPTLITIHVGIKPTFHVGLGITPAIQLILSITVRIAIGNSLHVSVRITIGNGLHISISIAIDGDLHVSIRVTIGIAGMVGIGVHLGRCVRIEILDIGVIDLIAVGTGISAGFPICVSTDLHVGPGIEQRLDRLTATENK